jgi:hypothetical protein
MKTVRPLASMILLLFVGVLHAELVLPGMQPKEGNIDFNYFGAENCAKCHAVQENAANYPYFTWQGGMMAQAARDPVFRAALAIANQDIPDVGGYCIRCHSPRGWLAGRSTAADASLLTQESDDMNGVSCAVCHRLVDPLSEEAAKFAKQVPPGYGDAMYVVDTADVVRGPYPDPAGVAPHHKRVQSSYQASGQLCGNCHDVSNPTLAQDSDKQPPHAFGPIERTFSEWLLSDFAKGDNPRTCQSCHFPQIAGGGQATKTSAHRDYFVRHGATGGSTWVQDALYAISIRRNPGGKDAESKMIARTFAGLDHEALLAGKARAREFLKTAAALGLECSGGRAALTITNLTGHKLPTGYPEGRRMWINVRFLNGEGKLLSELGQYGARPDTLSGRAVTVPTLLDPEKTRVYECLPGLSKEQADKYHNPPGASFHFILNDVVTKDNRIPPLGFNNAAFASHLAAPVGAEYADGQNWDRIEFPLPPGAAQVEVRLLYQSVSWEYLKFLVEENRSDSWSRLLYDAWEKTDQCPPEEIASASARVQP